MSNQIVVNGVQVYSDKQVSSIVGTRVSFSDGSYADVATGEVVNRGAGYINLGSKPEATGENKTVTKSFEATNIEMSDLIANANIQLHDGKTVEVTITGPESLVKDIEGKVTVGNTDGNLRASIGGTGSVHAGRVKKINGRISGSGEIIIASANGDAKLRISGSGSANINGGEIDELEVSVAGSGSARINAKANDADLDVSGVGNIYVHQVVNRPRRRVSGVGNINVGNW